MATTAPPTPAHPALRDLGVRILDPPAPARTVLGPVSAIREVVLVGRAAADGRGLVNSGDRASLAGDAQRALDKLGPAFAHHLGPRLPMLRRSTLGQLGKLLDSPTGALRAATSAGSMLVALSEQGAAVAAWNDCIDAHRTGADLDTCDQRVLQLREVLEARGHDWQQLSRQLSRLLAENDLEHARDLVGLPPRPDPSAVWVAFGDAVLPTQEIDAGCLTFLDGRSWPDNAERFPEISGDALADMRLLAQPEYFVWVRVALEGTAPSSIASPEDVRLPAVHRARELVESIISGATFRVGGSGWKMQTGALAIYEDGSHVAHDQFEDPDYRDRVRSFRAPPKDRTGEQLHELDSTLVRALAERRSDAVAVINEVNWYEAAQRVRQPAQRLALHVRALEHALPIGRDETWSDHARRYLRDHWVRDQFDSFIFTLAWRVGESLRHHAPKSIAEAGDFIVWEDTPNHNYVVSYAQFARSADRLAQQLPENEWRLRVLARRVAKGHTDHAYMLQWFDTISQEFDVLLKRAVRQRNAIIHGVPIEPSLVASVVDFVADLSAYVVAQSVHSITDRTSIIAAFDLANNESAMTRRALSERSKPVATILWVPRDPG